MSASVFPSGIRINDSLNDTGGYTITESPTLLGTPNALGDITVLTAGGAATAYIAQGVSGSADWVPFAGAAVVTHAEITFGVASSLANTTTPFYWTPPRNVTITGFTIVGAGYTSALGTCLLTVSAGTAFGDNLLAGTNVDLETIVAGTSVVPILTATAADLDIDAGDQIRAQIVSDNADLAGGTLTFIISYRARV